MHAGSVQRLFGARLMLDPERVAACCDAIRRRVGERIPLSVKCRLGVNDRDSYEDLASLLTYTHLLTYLPTYLLT